MSDRPFLSIVTPTRGSFSEDWLNRLLSIRGNVEFNLVYPPNTPVQAIDDPRVRTFVSPYKGEVMQRFVGLLNATGTYTLALDDDDLVHPEVLTLAQDYFQQFPESWVLRLRMEKIDVKDQERLNQPWADLPQLSQLQIVKPGEKPTHKEKALLELPIAPLHHPFDPGFLVFPYHRRKDMHGTHIENFNNKIWRTTLVHEALGELSKTMHLSGALTWIPFWSLDRLLGLFIQAHHFTPDQVIGHWLPAPAQMRYVVMPQSAKQELRFILPADALLLKRFPRYGYFWNLCFEQFWVAVRKIAHAIFYCRSQPSKPGSSQS